MQHSEKFDLVSAALVSAKKVFSKAKKSGENNHLKNKYSTLTDILEAVQPALDDNDLMVSQYMRETSTERVMHLETMILHSSGQFLKFQYNMPIEKTTAQAYGSTTSYGRRYALAAALGITQSDDDAEIAKRSPEDYKKLISSCLNIDDLRAIHENAKKALSPAEWKIVESYLVEKKSVLVAESKKTEARGFNPAAPAAVAQPENKVDETENKKQNTPEDIEGFN